MTRVHSTPYHMLVTGLNLQRAILGAIVAALLAGIIPAGFALDRRLAAALDQRARDDLALAPQLFNDRTASTADALMMHAKDLAHLPGLADAVASGNRLLAIRLVDAAHANARRRRRGSGRTGRRELDRPASRQRALARTRAGEMPVSLSLSATAINNVAVAPVTTDNIVDRRGRPRQSDGRARRRSAVRPHALGRRGRRVERRDGVDARHDVDPADHRRERGGSARVDANGDSAVDLGG